MNIKIGKKAIVTTDNWFYTPDGRNYRAVFGTIKAVKTAEETLGIRPNGRSANWYVEIGNMTIAGCQIHYAVQSDECNVGLTDDFCVSPDGRITEYTRPSSIYFAD